MRQNKRSKGDDPGLVHWLSDLQALEVRGGEYHGIISHTGQTSCRMEVSIKRGPTVKLSIVSLCVVLFYLLATNSGNAACTTTVQLLKNANFDNGADGSWKTFRSAGTIGEVINSSTNHPARSGRYKARLNGQAKANTMYANQQITIPTTACTAKLSFYLWTATEDATSIAHDKMTVQVIVGTTTKTLATYTNLNKNSQYAKRTIDLLAYKGKTIKVQFYGKEDATYKTTFLVDDTALTVTK